MPSRLRIGVNALYLIPGGVGGTEIYLRNLLAALADIDRRNEYFVYTNRETDADLCPAQANFAPVPTGVRAAFRPGRLAWERLRLPAQTRADRLDVLFSPGFTAPSWGAGKRVTVVHDLQHVRQPENFGFFERRAWNWSVRSAVANATLVVTVSDNSKRDIEQEYDVAPDRVRVVRHGVEDAFFGLRENEAYGPELPAAAGLPSDARYLLAVSTVHPHKNWDTLIDAYAALAREGSELHLAVSGLPGKAWETIQDKVSKARLADRVHLLGWQPRERLIGLFKFAEALVFPSSFEGFGMPVLEAMAAELPVVCSDIPPLREIADGCAHFFDPASSGDLAAILRGALQDAARRRTLVEAGKKRAAGYTWRRSAERTLALFLEASQR